jgi:predicted enzyme related to lactoylglutathione lyase
MKKYIADRRLYRAAITIRDTKARIIDIAVSCGFSSQEALTRALKSAYGCTPNDLRRNPYTVAITDPKAVLPSDNSVKDYIEKGKQIMTGFSRKLVSYNIVTSDPRRLAYFYRDILGADICEEHGGPHRIEIWFGDRNESAACIVANYDEGFVPQTFNACQGFEIHVPDADTEYKRIWDLGVEVKEPPKDLPWGVRYFNIKDPDGNGIDIVAQL